MDADWIHVSPHDIIWLKDYRRCGPLRPQRVTLTCKHTSFLQCYRSRAADLGRNDFPPPPRPYAPTMSEEGLLAPSPPLDYHVEGVSRLVSTEDHFPTDKDGRRLVYVPRNKGVWPNRDVAVTSTENSFDTEPSPGRSPYFDYCRKCRQLAASDRSPSKGKQKSRQCSPKKKPGSRPTWRDIVIGDGAAPSPNRCYRKHWATPHMDGVPNPAQTNCIPSSCQQVAGDTSPRFSRRTRKPSADKDLRRNGSVREPRAFSLERATTDTLRKKKENHRGNHFTPPRKYMNQWKQACNDPYSCSSQKASERPPCGPGPPLKQAPPYSVEAISPSSSTPGSGRPRQRSSSGNGAAKKTPVRRLDEEALKRSRLHNNQYELSQDLLDKQVEMLERKYGGVRARHAALTIQRAFRKYCMVKRFQDIANASKGEKRLSRRFHSLDVDSKDWGLYNGSSSGLHLYQYEPDETPSMVHSSSYIDAVLKSNIATLYRELGEGYAGEPKSSRPSLDHDDEDEEECREDAPLQSKEMAPYSGVSQRHKLDSSGLELQANSSVLEDSTYMTPVRSPPSVPRHPAWTAVPSTGGPRASHHAMGPTVFLTPSHPASSPSADQFHTPRESVSSEDSAISSGGVEGDSVSEEPQLRRDCPTRHTTGSGGSRHEFTSDLGLHRSPARASDISLGKKDLRKVPPRVPKRISSIASHDMKSWREGSGGDMSPSGSSSYDHCSHGTPGKMCAISASPVWKRKSLIREEQVHPGTSIDDKRLSNISENSEDGLDVSGGYSTSMPASDMIHSLSGHGYSDPTSRSPHDVLSTPSGYKVSEIQRKRQYRVGLNLFNKKPDRGIRYLIHQGFLEASPQAIARFLISRKGLSKQMAGEYLGNLQNSFNMAVLECFVQELDLAGMQVDVALRKFQTFFRMPGEAQKIERLVEVFSHRYIDCNRDIVAKFQNPDTVFVLAFAIIMLNTDLHTPNMKADKRMKLEDFIKNLRGIDDGHDLDRDMLVGIYERIKSNEFKPGSDHVTQVIKVQQTIVGKKPNLALPHRRLVCYCRLYEVYDVNRKERMGVHQREVFLFNDMLMVTKILSKKKNGVTYSFRQSFPLCGMSVTLFEAPYYPHGIRLSQRVDDKVLITFNARNEHDRSKFVEDLKESILEMDEMENLRIEAELEKQKMLRARGGENRDSGVADMEMLPSSSKDGKLSPDNHSNNLKRSALSNSLLDLHEQPVNKPVRRGSAGSLDSGMSISFQSSTASTVSHDSSPQTVHTSTSGVEGATGRSVDGGGKTAGQQGFLGGLFSKKGKAASKSHPRRPTDPGDIL